MGLPIGTAALQVVKKNWIKSNGALTLSFIRQSLRGKKCQLFLCPICPPSVVRGCAHVKVYLKSFNEPSWNGSWSSRYTEFDPVSLESARQKRVPDLVPLNGRKKFDALAKRPDAFVVCLLKYIVLCLEMENCPLVPAQFLKIYFPLCFFLPMDELSAPLRAGQGTRCERWSVWLAPMVLWWTILNVMLQPDPPTHRWERHECLSSSLVWTFSLLLFF